MGKRKSGPSSSSSSKRKKRGNCGFSNGGDESKSSEMDFLEPQRSQLYDLLDRNIIQKESTSVLLVGARGSGKVKVLNRVLSDLRECYSDGAFLAVYLNGFLQSDDTTAMRVMCREISKNFDTENEEIIKKNSFAENLIYLRETLLKAKDKNLPIFFILDEFDLFANRTKQTLLYNLFDSLHDKSSHIALIGITTHQNVFELLEKRIRSRFSQRRILFTSEMEFSTMLQILKGELSDTALSSSLDHIYEDKNISKALRHHFDCGRSITWFRNLHIVALSRLPEKVKEVSVEHFSSSLEYFTSDFKALALKDCSVMELVLLVAMANLEFKDIAPSNFAQVYYEYEQCHKHNAIVKRHHYPRNVARKGFERLVEGCLISEAGSGKNLSQFSSKEYKPYHLSIEPDVVVSKIKNEMRDDVPLWLREWVTRR